MILSLLSVEIDMMITWLTPLDLADREMTVLQVIHTQKEMLLKNNHKVGREGAKQMDDVGKWRDDVRTRTLGKQWTEYARHAWDISPTLAVFLPTWLNNSAVLVSEVSRLVRASPTKVGPNFVFPAE